MQWTTICWERFSPTLQQQRKKVEPIFARKIFALFLKKFHFLKILSFFVSNDAFNEKLESSIHGSILGFTSIFVNRLKHLCSALGFQKKAVWEEDRGREKSKGGFLGRRKSYFGRFFCQNKGLGILIQSWSSFGLAFLNLYSKTFAILIHFGCWWKSPFIFLDLYFNEYSTLWY